jgi:hypothetical protein
MTNSSCIIFCIDRDSFVRVEWGSFVASFGARFDGFLVARGRLHLLRVPSSQWGLRNAVFDEWTISGASLVCQFKPVRQFSDLSLNENRVHSMENRVHSMDNRVHSMERIGFTRWNTWGSPDGKIGFTRWVATEPVVPNLLDNIV